MSAELPDGCERSTVGIPFFPGMMVGLMGSDIVGRAPGPPVDWQRESLPVGSSRRVGTLEHFAIYLDVFLEVGGYVLFRKDRGDRTLRLAGTAVDALVRMDVELFRSLVNAVHRTNIDAGAVLRILAGFSYYVGHVIPDYFGGRDLLQQQPPGDSFAKNRPARLNSNRGLMA